MRFVIAAGRPLTVTALAAGRNDSRTFSRTESTGTIIIPDKAFNAIGNGFVPDFPGLDAFLPGVHKLTLILGVVAYPLVLTLMPLGLASFRWAGHDPAQIPLESTYFRVLMYGTLIMLARSAISGFFSGIGRTRIIMFANIAALVVNTLLAWMLIFGRFGAPQMGMSGAALALLTGETVALLILLGAYLTPANRAEFAVDRAWRFDREVMWRLLAPKPGQIPGILDGSGWQPPAITAQQRPLVP